MRYLKKLSLLAIIVSFLFCLTAYISPVLAKDYGLETAAEGTGIITNKGTTPGVIAGTVVGAVLSLVGVVFFLLILYGGLRWMLAQGNEQDVETAKKIIIAAVIGLIIVLAAYAITAFVGTQLTNPT